MAALFSRRLFSLNFLTLSRRSSALEIVGTVCRKAEGDIAENLSLAPRYTVPADARTNILEYTSCDALPQGGIPQVITDPLLYLK